METLKILVVGASGYIGGSVLTQLQHSTDPNIKAASISALVRSEGQAAVLRDHRYRPILFTGLEDTAFLRQVASEHDVVINCAISYNVSAAEAFVNGLSDRLKNMTTTTTITPFFIHTSGTSSIAIGAAGHHFDLPAAHSDTDDVYGLLQRLESVSPYAQRTTDLAVINTGLSTSIPTYIIMPPLIYGLGSGHFNRLTVQEPAIITKARALGYTPLLAGSGHGSHNHVHIADLAKLYELLLSNLLGESSKHGLPKGEKGIYFAEAGQHTWLEVSQGVARAGVELQVLATDDVREMSAEQWAVGGSGSKTLPAIPEIIAHSMGSHGLTKAALARNLLAWEPQMGEDAWREHFTDEFKAVLAEQRNG